MQVHPGNGNSRRGPATWFSGTVWLDPLVAANTPSTLRVTRVSFEPGARTAWHTHPLGQGIHIVSGVCQAQVRGGAVVEVQAGGLVWFAPGEIHWHGAKPGHTMVHLAMQQADEHNVDVVWLEQVSEAELAAG